MEGLQGAILRVKLRHLEAWTEARRENAARYTVRLADSNVAVPFARPDCRHVYHVYAVRTDDRASLQARLQAEGIQTGLHYPIPVHLQPAHRDLGYCDGQFPESENAARQVLSLPMYPELTDAQIDAVCAAVKAHEYVA
jgi:dTDP-4-amino-4,6-dideoxygalactose transaminase